MSTDPSPVSGAPAADGGRRPLVTFALFAYNQERYIAEAIEGAFAQTYDPLEIILSDDCSPDGTYEAMQRAASSYSGRHTVKVYRNEENLGLIERVDRIVDHAGGEIIVAAAGDDVSFPERTVKLVDAWIGSGRKANSIHSAAMAIDQAGRELGIVPPPADFAAGQEPEKIARKLAYVVGATHAWTKNVFDVFGPMVERRAYEDLVIAFRSSLLGPIAYVDAPLVEYRTGASVARKSGMTRLEYLDFRIAVLSQRMRDYRIFSGGKDMKILRDAIEDNSIQKNLIEGKWKSVLVEARTALQAVFPGHAPCRQASVGAASQTLAWSRRVPW